MQTHVYTSGNINFTAECHQMGLVVRSVGIGETEERGRLGRITSHQHVYRFSCRLYLRPKIKVFLPTLFPIAISYRVICPNLLERLSLQSISLHAGVMRFPPCVCLGASSHDWVSPYGTFSVHNCLLHH